MAEDVGAWFAARMPAGWFVGPPEVSADGEEVLVVGQLPDVELTSATSGAARAAARSARIERFREETREDRVRIAREAERHFRRKVAWVADVGGRLADDVGDGQVGLLRRLDGGGLVGGG